jgi:hypothetical protein
MKPPSAVRMMRWAGEVEGRREGREGGGRGGGTVRVHLMWWLSVAVMSEREGSRTGRERGRERGVIERD